MFSISNNKSKLPNHTTGRAGMQHITNKIVIFLLFFFISNNILATNKLSSTQKEPLKSTNIEAKILPSLVKNGMLTNAMLQSSDSHYQGRVYLHSALGKVEPTFVNLTNGKWLGSVTFYDIGKSNYLTLLWDEDNKFKAGSNKSYSFDVTDLSGSIESNAELSGNVISTNNPHLLEYATVQLFNDHPKNGGQKIYSTLTDNNGNYKFKNIVPGVYCLIIEKEGYQRFSKEVVLAAKRVTTEDCSLPCICNNVKGLTPILLVPGIMGSHTAGPYLSVYPHLPVIPPSWDSNGLALFNPDDRLGWNTLKNSLKSFGYVEGCTLLDVPYYWSYSVPDARDAYLLPWIKQAKLLSGSDKVDIIAHSMGGLLARSYIQSKDYAGDVRRIAIVGTPNKGADLIYYMWEGGDPITADIIQHDTEIYAKYFYTNTLDYFYIDRYSDQVCEYYKDPYEPIACDNDKIYNLLHSRVLSAGQLIPIFDHALVHKQKNVTLVHEENTLLKALSSNPVCYNPKGCIGPGGDIYSFIAPQNIFSSDPGHNIDKVYAMLFIGVNVNPSIDTTVNSILVEPQPDNYTGYIYKDGVVQGLKVLRNYGDGTVLMDSVHFDEAFKKGLDYSLKSAEHMELIAAFTTDIIEFITGFKVGRVEQKVPSNKLVINIRGRVQPKIISIINQDGKVTSLDSSSIKQTLKSDYSSLEIKDPVEGKYSISLNSPHNDEDYELTLSYHKDNKMFARRYYGYFDKSSDTFSFAINNNSSEAPMLYYDKIFDVPSKLTLENVNNKIRVSWQDDANNIYKDVDYYEIYWKDSNKPHMHLLAQTKQKEYLTAHDWKDARTITYAVRAILKDGTSTFFSPLAFFVPTIKKKH